MRQTDITGAHSVGHFSIASSPGCSYSLEFIKEGVKKGGSLLTTGISI